MSRSREVDIGMINALSEFITHEREKQGYSRNRLSQLAGVSHGTIDNLENAQPRRYEFEIVYRILQALGFELNIVERVNPDGDNS